METLLAEISRLISVAEDLGAVPKGLTYYCAPDGCMVMNEGGPSDPPTKWVRMQNIGEGGIIYPVRRILQPT